MTPPVKVTVLLPVYNGGDALLQAVRSICAQTLSDFELFILDDGSTDHALQAVSRLADPRIRLMGDHRRLGIAARLNEGIAAASGIYIARMDADDLAFPQRLARQAEFLDRHAAIDLVGCRALVFREWQGIIGALPFAAGHAEICARPWRGFRLPHPTWMGRAAWFRRYSYAVPETRRAEDQELLLRAAPDSRYACLDDILLAYRQDRFRLGKTLTARWHLWRAQRRIFWARRQIGNLVFSLAAGLVKTIADMAASLPGCERFFFARMQEKVDPQTAAAFYQLQQNLTGDRSEKPRKLLYLLTEDWFFCSHFIERATAARRAGYDVVVVTRMAAHADAIQRRGLRPVALDLNRRSVNPWAAFGTIRRLREIYRVERPDILHHVALKPIIYGTLSARLAGVRSIVNAPVGMGYVFASRSLPAFFLRLLVRLALRILLNPAGSKVIFENDADRHMLVSGGYVRRQDAMLIRGAGIDIDVYRPSPEPSGPPVVTLAARMLWDKGVGEFVEAARLLKNAGIRARFCLVGSPDPHNRASIDEKTLRGWHAEGVVEWLGFRADMTAVLEHTHIVCLPSYREGLPKSLLEGLACGKPVVTSDVPGCRETVSDGLNGYLVPPRDAEALARALGKLIASPERRLRMGQAGRSRAEQEFAQSRIISETLAVYQQMKINTQ